MTAKIEAADSLAFKTIVIPRSNLQDVLLDDQWEGKVEVIAVDTLDEVMEHALIKHEQKASLVERLGGIVRHPTSRASHPRSVPSAENRGGLIKANRFAYR